MFIRRRAFHASRLLTLRFLTRVAKATLCLMGPCYETWQALGMLALEIVVDLLSTAIHAVTDKLGKRLKAGKAR